MSKLAKTTFKILDILVIFVMTFASPLGALAAPSSTGATIASDLADYPPGAIVTLTGAGWVVDEPVHIYVNDDAGKTWEHNSNPDPVADGSGAFTYTFQLPTWFIANYSVTASGPYSGTATASFTDMSIGLYDQCSNDLGAGYASGDTGCRWINGNLQSNNSTYQEGDATVQRLWLTDLIPGSTHTVTLKYGTTKGGSHAYDFLTTWDWSEDWITLADRCQGIIGCETAAESFWDIPQDPNVPDSFEPSAPGDRQFVMRGGSLSSASTPAIASGTYSGDSETAITITFTVGASNGSMCSTKNGLTTCGVAIWFGAHVAAQANWGLGMGAGAISGSPYHVALVAQDGASVGQRDNQMQANAVAVIPNGTIIIVKDAVPDDAQDFNFNLNNASTITQDFSLDDDANATLPNSQTFSVPPGTWYASELTPLPAGWAFTNLACVDPTSNTTVSGADASINLASNETVTCTYTNTKGAHIIVEKQTDPDGAKQQFEFDPSWGANFSLGDGQTNDSGPLPAGTYSVAELNVPSPWSMTGATCTDGSPVDAIVLTDGEMVTCTFNNSWVFNQDLTVSKTAVPSFGRTYAWDIHKNVDKTTANIPDGGSATFNYTVGVTHDNGTDTGFVVSGVITVHNPNSFAVSGVDVTDAAPGGTCTVANGTGLTVPANGDATANYSCTFESDPGSGTNTATAAWDATANNTPNGTASGTADFDFAGVAPSVTNGTVTVTDTFGGDLGTVSSGDPSPKEFTYSHSFPGVAGTCTNYDNTATITETGKFASKTVEVCVGKDLTVTKTASGSLTRTYKWLIDKSVDDTRIEIAEGGAATFNYSIKVTPDGYTDSGYALGGTITLTNPNDWEDITVDVADALDKGGTCTITEAAPYIVPKDGSLTLHYTCTTDGSATQNTATVTWNKAAYFTPGSSASADAVISFGVAGATDKVITVVDDKTDPANPVPLGTWDWDDGGHSFTYSLEKQGVAGTCTNYTNTAVIEGTDQSDSQTVTVCVGKDLTVAKTAEGTFDRSYQWKITKDVDQTLVKIAEGGSYTFHYTVQVEQTGISDAGWNLAGKITISNPNDWEDITLTDLTDAVDNGGTCTLDQGPYKVLAGKSLDVNYSCSYDSAPGSYSGTNTATATWDKAAAFTPNGSASGSAGFTLAQLGATSKTVHVTDSFGGDLGTVTATDAAPFAAATFTYERTESGVAGTCTKYDNTATITETKQTADKSVTLCVGQDLTVTKTAKGSFDRTYKWLIDKSVDQTVINIAKGGTATFNYTVTVTLDGYTDSGYALGGTITIFNPNDWEDITADVIDDFPGGDCTVTDGEDVVISAGQSVTLPYSCAFASQPTYSGTNTATATWDKALYFTPGDTASGTADVTLGLKGETNKVITVVDDKTDPANPVTLGTADYSAGPFEFTYSLAKQGVAGQCTDYTNTAAIDETDQSDSQTVTVCVGQDLTVTKTAVPSFTRTWAWTITKDSDATYSLFAGDTVTHGYKVTVTPSSTDSAWKVVGTITISNPNQWKSIVAQVSDAVGNGGACVVAEDEVTVPAKGSVEVGYTCTWDSKPTSYTGTNTATVTWDAALFSTPTGTASGSADFGFTNPTEINPVITVDDSNLTGENWTADRQVGEWTYTRDFACSTNPADYTDGKYSYSHPNTATIIGTDKADTANVTVNCYVPAISKTANGSYDEVHDWEVFKTVNTASQNAFAGEKRNFNWTVRVDETTHGENYLVTGVITVVNPNPDDALTVALNDKLNDGSVAAIGPCTGGTWIAPNLTVPAGDTATCEYSVTPKGDMGAFNAALPSQVTMSVQYPVAGGPAYFPVTTVSGDGSLNGTYEGWCADMDHTIAQNTNYTANVYSSYESLPAGIIEKAYNLDLVNWIINQDYVGKSAGGSLGNYTYGDVQRAIWELIENETSFSTSGLNSWNQVRVNQIKAAAITNGEGFVPTCGDFVAVILQPVGGQQLVTIAQVTFASLGVDCAKENAVTAVMNEIDFKASAQILWTANPINPTASLDDDQKLDWPTTVSADTTFPYADPQGYTCPVDPALYTNGVYQYTENNTAVLTFATGSDTATASTKVNCYAPVVSKTAAGTYNERHEWDIQKSVDPASQDAFAGDMVSYDWTVTVTESVFEENFGISGQISITNPHPTSNMVVSLTDVLDVPSPVTITACTNATYALGKWTITKASTAVCDYTVIPTGRTAALNTATVTNFVGNLPKLTVTASDPIEWTPNVIRGSATLDDEQNPAFPREITDGGVWTYPDSYTCSTDQASYTNGSYTYPEDNTATLTSGETNDSASAHTQVICHAPVVTKDVTTYFNRDWDWSIVKEADASYNLFAGGTVTHGYTVTVTPTYTDNFWGVKGTITIANSHPTEPMTLTSLSDLAGGINGKVTCESLVVPAKGSLVCTYDTGPQNNPDANPFGDTNIATAVFGGANWTGSAAIAFSAAPTTENEAVITVDDNNLAGEDWSANREAGEWTYTKDFACSTDQAEYTDGKYSFNHLNTATINETGQTDSATVEVNCHAPVVTKTVATYFNRDWDWTITKDFDGSYDLFAGDTVTHNYKVTVTPTYSDNFWGVKGNITVYNYHPTEALTLTALTDLAGGINGKVTCESLVVPANGSLDCTYDTGPQDTPNANPFGDINIATAVFGGANWTGSAAIAFSATPTTEDEAVITVDDNNLDDEDWSANREAGEWTYTKDFACSTDPAKYTDGKYSFSHPNTATITETGQADTAMVDVTCYWPQIELTKTGDDLSKIGDAVTYNFKLDNNTPTDPGLRDLSCTISDTAIGFSKTVSLASGASDTSTQPFTIPAGAADPYLNTASVTCNPLNSEFSVSDESTWSTNLFQPKVEIIKTGPAYATSGDVITYSFTINNLSSSDSPNLLLDSVIDNVLGDLKTAALAAGCDNLAPAGTCSFTANYTVPDVGLQAYKKTNIVTVHYHPAGFPNDITDVDDHTVTLVPRSQLTNTSYCPLPNDQFRLLYRLQIAPNTYMLNGSNPGQFYYNAFYYGTPGSDFTMSIEVPYPFMTQEGAGNPIQVHDGTGLTSGGCFAPTPSLSGFTITTQAMTPASSAGNQIITPEDYTTQQPGQTTTVTVSGQVPATGFAYVTIHLDYSLKKTSQWKPAGSFTTNPVTGASIGDMNNATGFGDGPVTIHGYEVYNFARTVGSDTSTSSPSSYNEIKKFAGFLGFVTDTSTEQGVAGVKVVIYNPLGKVLATVYTDEDGYYMFAYKHTAKSATYKVTLPGYAKSVAITVKANGFAPVDFEVP